MAMKRLTVRNGALCGVMALCLVPAPLLAQEAAGGLDEIVVTANKRQESLSKVGLTVNVLSADGSFDAASGTVRERRLTAALKKQLPGVPVRVRQFIVPVFYGAVMDLRWTHAQALSRAAVLKACESALPVHDERDGETLPTPVSQGVSQMSGTLSRLQVEAEEAMACVLADPLRVGIVQPLLATLMVQG